MVLLFQAHYPKWNFLLCGDTTKSSKATKLRTCRIILFQARSATCLTCFRHIFSPNKNPLIWQDVFVFVAFSRFSSKLLVLYVGPLWKMLKNIGSCLEFEKLMKFTGVHRAESLSTNGSKWLKVTVTPHWGRYSLPIELPCSRKWTGTIWQLRLSFQECEMLNKGMCAFIVFFSEKSFQFLYACSFHHPLERKTLLPFFNLGSNLWKKNRKHQETSHKKTLKPKRSKELMSSLTVCNYIHLKKTPQKEFGENDGV